MSPDDFFGLLERGATAAGYAVTAIPGERMLGKSMCVRIHEKRCVAQISETINKPAGNTFGTTRFAVRNSLTLSDSDVKAVVLVVAPANEAPVFYVVPARDWKALVRAQGQSTRSGKGAAPALIVSHPPQTNSRLEPYRDNWKALA